LCALRRFTRRLRPALACKLIALLQLVEFAAVAFGRAAFAGEHGRKPKAVVLTRLGTRRGGRGRFGVECLSNRGGAAEVAESEDLDFKFAAFRFNAEHDAGDDVARGFDVLAVVLDAAEVAGFGGERARFVEAGGPEPLIEADGGERCGHDLYLTGA